MPRGGDTGAGLAPFEKGSFRLSATFGHSFNLEGGHDESRGLSVDGQVIAVPLHRHEVSLDLTLVEVTAKYAFADGWDTWFRLPYAIKNQSVTLDPIDPATPAELEAMRRNSGIHHRDEVYHGLHDPKLMVAHHRWGIFREGDAVSIAFGTSMPIGETEEDPYILGDDGKEHLHIQFGTGTFDPLLELSYASPIGRQLSLSGFAQSRVSVYENDKTFKGPPEINAGVTLSRALSPAAFLRATYNLFYQGYAYWDGVRDENSGLLSSASVFGGGLAIGDGAQLNFDAMIPLAQKVLSEAEDAFRQGPTVLVSVSYRLR